jgi:hypothetical protein
MQSSLTVSNPLTFQPASNDTIHIAGKDLASPTVKWITSHSCSSARIDQLLSDVWAGKAIAVSDGSYFEQYSTAAAAWIISSADGQEWIEGGGIVPGAILDLNSYRAQLAGLLVISVGFQCLGAIYPHDMVAANVVACDSIRALEKTAVERHKVKGSWKSVDLITQLLDIWRVLPFQPTAKHVYGHLDDRVGPLTFLEHLNVRMDLVAKSIVLRNLGRSQQIPQPLSLGYGTISVGGI